jgi:multidrug efflux system membrane fusion protein
MGRPCFLAALSCSFLAACGCESEPGPAAKPETPGAPVARPIQRDVTSFEDFTGRTDAVQVVDVRARVTGYLDRMPFREGTEVSEGDVLFEIDPRPYKAQYDQAKSQIDLNEASHRLAQQTYARDAYLAPRGAASRQDLDTDRAAVDEAEARLKASRASLEVFQLNLAFTKVTAPIDGRVSRYYVTRGNLVNQDQTLLTTIVSLDPMYAYFDMDEATLLRIRRAVSEGRLTLPEDGVMPVYMGLQGEDGYPHRGTINFFNNQVNSGTGSISVRGVFPNPPAPGNLPTGLPMALGCLGSPLGQGNLVALPTLVSRRFRTGPRLLSPGMFVRIRLPLGQPRPSLLVIDRAIQSDQGQKFVYVVDADDVAQYRRVSTGALQEDGLRVILKGLEPDDRVVVGSLQQIRQRQKVQPEEVAMPMHRGGSSGGARNAEAGPEAAGDAGPRRGGADSPKKQGGRP